MHEIERTRRAAYYEVVAMAEHCFLTGKAVPPDLTATLDGFLDRPDDDKLPNFSELQAPHAILSRLVAPAIPLGIHYLSMERKRNFSAEPLILRIYFQLGPVPTIRHMALISLVSLLWFILLSAFGHIESREALLEQEHHWVQAQMNFDHEAGSKDAPPAFEIVGTVVERIAIVKDSINQYDWNQIIISTYYLSAAAIGASFFNLFTAYRFVRAGTYSPLYNSSYWIRLALGLTSGFVLATLLPEAAEQGVSRTMLALLGGFSASAVYLILARLIESVESVFRGDVKGRINREVAQAHTNFKAEQLAKGAEQLKFVTALRADLVEKGLPPADADAMVEKMIKRLVEA